MKCAVESAPFSCGLGVIGEFSRSASLWNYSYTDIADLNSGTGYFIAAFIDSEKCRMAFEEIQANHRILYKSDVRINANSGNAFFFIVFDVKKTKRAVRKYSYPKTFKQGA